MQFVVIIFYIFTSYVQAFELKVAPEVICTDLDPVHILQDPRNMSEPGSSPFRVVSNSSLVEIGWSAVITVEATENIRFKGFLLQARFDNLTCGRFLPQKDVQLIECTATGGNAEILHPDDRISHLAIHLDNTLKRSFQLVWIAPDYLLGDVDFFLSVIVVRSRFWRVQKFTPLEVTYDNELHPKMYTEPKKKKYRTSEEFPSTFLRPNGSMHFTQTSSMSLSYPSYTPV